MDDKELQKTLEFIGLTKVESRVYITLLNEGPSLANTLSRRSGIHRRSIYDVMDRLIDKGLVNYIVQNKKRYFSATSPHRLSEVIEEQESSIKRAMPELDAKYSENKEKQETSFFRGKEGLKSVFEDQIDEGKEILIMGGSKKAHNTLKYYFPHYDKRRIEKKIKVKFLLDGSARNDREIKAIPLKEARYFPNSIEGNTSTCIYGNKVAIIVWADSPVALLIKNSEIAKSYRANFSMLWDVYKP